MEEPKNVRIQKETVVCRSAAVELGPVHLNLPDGPALCFDAEECTLVTIAHANGGKYVVIVSAAEAERGGRMGLMACFTPEECRLFAASMLRAADEADGDQKGLN